MSHKRKNLGREGEDLAVEFLKGKGYKILERNYRSSLGEIDIIARDQKAIVFVEVRTRESLSYGWPQASVDRFKQHQIIRVALSYLSWKGLKDSSCRFDVVAVAFSPDRKAHKIELFKDAFQVEERYYTY